MRNYLTRAKDCSSKIKLFDKLATFQAANYNAASCREFYEKGTILLGWEEVFYGSSSEGRSGGF